MWPAHQHHVAKLVQLATATCAYATSSFWWGQGKFSNKFFFARMFFNFYLYKDENKNSSKLQGRKSYLRKK